MAAEPQVYELLAQALLYPDDSFVARVHVRCQSLSGILQWAAAMVDALDGEEGLEDLQTEHVRLFVNAYGGSPCLPYESVFTEGRVLGEVAYELKALYAQWGVEETREMADHAAVELAFAAQLARMEQLPEMEANRNLVRETLETFERDHLRAWLPSLAADLQAEAHVSFYRAVGRALSVVFGAGGAGTRSRHRAGASDDLFLDLAA